MTGNALCTVDFHGARLVAVGGETPAATLVAMRPIVEAMGLAWERQFVKIKTHPVLAPTVTMMITVAEDGKHREMTALPLNRLNFWLATIHPSKLPDPDTRAKVILYQTECADALFAYFFPAPATTEPAVVQAENLAETDPTVRLGDNIVLEQHALSIIREVRLVFGLPAARALWRRSPLPQIDDGTTPVTAMIEDDGGVREFLAERTRCQSGAEVTGRALYDAYASWRRANGRAPDSETRFGRRAKQHLPWRISGCVYYRDIVLLQLAH